MIEFLDPNKDLELIKKIESRIDYWAEGNGLFSVSFLSRYPRARTKCSHRPRAEKMEFVKIAKKSTLAILSTFLSCLLSQGDFEIRKLDFDWLRDSIN